MDWRGYRWEEWIEGDKDEKNRLERDKDEKNGLERDKDEKDGLEGIQMRRMDWRG